MESIDELTCDCEELQKLLKSASRSNVRQLLASEITLLQKKINQLEEENKRKEVNGLQTDDQQCKKSKVSHVFTKKIDSYGWDQNDKTVKIYVTLPGIEKIPKENVKLDVTPDSFEFKVLNLDGKNHALRINKLLDQVDPESSLHKVKSGNAVITLKKTVSKRWEFLTSTEKKVKEEKTPKLDKDGDPMSSITSLMKQMYDDGDDEMKRTIAKAMVESREKQASGKSAFDI